MIKKYIYKIHYGGFFQLGDNDRVVNPKFPILKALNKVFVKQPFQFDNDSLQVAVNLWCDNKEEAEKKYGDINTWDVSQVTNMSRLFLGKHNFNSNISNWDISNVTYMNEMFRDATSFNNGGKPLIKREITKEDGTTYTAWNTSNVTNMAEMFTNASSFNQNIWNWNTSKVISMLKMFQNAKLFNQDISEWDTSNMISMALMFQDAQLFNQDISNWDTSNVTSMVSMFRNAKSFNKLTIGRWIIRNDCITDYMFQGSGITKERFVNDDGNRIKNVDFNRKIGEYFHIHPQQINYLRNITIRTFSGKKIVIINVNPYDQISYVKQIIRDNLKLNQDFRLATPTIPEMDTNRSINSYNIYQNGENLINIVI